MKPLSSVPRATWGNIQCFQVLPIVPFDPNIFVICHPFLELSWIRVPKHEEAASSECFLRLFFILRNRDRNVVCLGSDRRIHRALLLGSNLTNERVTTPVRKTEIRRQTSGIMLWPRNDVRWPEHTATEDEDIDEGAEDMLLRNGWRPKDVNLRAFFIFAKTRNQSATKQHGNS